MPTILRVGSCRFYFYSADGHEPRHVHIERDDQEVKFWLDPAPKLAYNRGFSGGEIRQLTRIVRANLSRLRRKWDEFFP